MDFAVSIAFSGILLDLVSKLVDVIEESVEWVGGFIGMRTVEVALAGFNHHHILVEGLAIFTAELDPDCSGLLRTAAPPIHAGTTILGPELLQTGATRIGELDQLTGFLGPAALLSLL